jgi:hypothetical protein
MTYEIILIESFSVNRNGDMEIVAILENMGKQTVQQTLYDPPEYAPARCKTVVSSDALPTSIKFRGKSTDELEELTNRYSLLVNQEWEVLVSDYSDDDHDDYYPTGAGMYF